MIFSYIILMVNKHPFIRENHGKSENDQYWCLVIVSDGEIMPGLDRCVDSTSPSLEISLNFK